MNESTQIDFFYRLSAILTGYSEVILYGTGQGGCYFSTLQDILGEELVADLLDEFEHQMKCAEADPCLSPGTLVKEAMLDDHKWGPVCRNVLKMWYMGNWYQMPDDWRESHVSSTQDCTKVLSSNAYIEGLVWRAMGQHPKSAKQPGYGTWATPPKTT